MTRVLASLWTVSALFVLMAVGAEMGASRASAVNATPFSEALCRPPEVVAPPTILAPTEEPPLGVPPTPTPAPDFEAVVDPLLEAMVRAAAANLEACWNGGDWAAVTGGVTPRFLETSLGIGGDDERQRAAALAALDLGTLRIETIGPVQLWSDGRGAVDVLYFRGRGDPVQVVAARWFFVAERGGARFDEEALRTPPPLGDRVTIGFGIADDVQPLQWASLTGGAVPALPVITLHGANRGLTAHTFILQSDDGAALGVLTLPPWAQGDLILIDLPSGTYQLFDSAVEGSALELEVTESSSREDGEDEVLPMAGSL